jgi:hypothetical protein
LSKLDKAFLAPQAPKILKKMTPFFLKNVVQVYFPPWQAQKMHEKLPPTCAAGEEKNLAFFDPNFFPPVNIGSTIILQRPN